MVNNMSKLLKLEFCFGKFVNTNTKIKTKPKTITNTNIFKEHGGSFARPGQTFLKRA